MREITEEYRADICCLIDDLKREYSNMNMEFIKDQAIELYEDNDDKAADEILKDILDHIQGIEDHVNAVLDYKEKLQPEKEFLVTVKVKARTREEANRIANERIK